MISPSSDQNAVLQLNMGEGKSSVIIPMVSAALATGTKLVRVVVLKPLATSMFQLLVSRLSGLVGRQVFYMPFSRSINIDAESARVNRTLYEQCAQTGRILLVQPEHILSFKLMGIDRRLSSVSADDPATAELLQLQIWLEECSRDISDESDEILQSKYQLIYTVGAQQPIEDNPDRWTTIQQVLSIMEGHAHEVREEFPLGIEVSAIAKMGSFPLIRILHSDAALALSEKVADSVMDTLPNCPQLSLFASDDREAALRFITEKEPPANVVRTVERICPLSSSSGQTLLLLRGLLAHGILCYALKVRRWRVDYGLDPSRSLLAVPYRAKDVPSLRAEFGHPDVCIILTCLSYLFVSAKSWNLPIPN